MFEMVSMIETLGGLSTILVAGSVALGGTVVLMVLRKPLQMRFSRRASTNSTLVPSAKRVELRAQPVAKPADPPQTEPNAGLQALAREGQQLTLCPPELSRRIDRLELKVKARSASRNG